MEGNWRADADEAWNDYIWGDYDRTSDEEEKAKDRLFKIIMKARDIQLLSVGRRARNARHEGRSYLVFEEEAG